MPRSSATFCIEGRECTTRCERCKLKVTATAPAIRYSTDAPFPVYCCLVSLSLMPILETVSGGDGTRELSNDSRDFLLIPRPGRGLFGHIKLCLASHQHGLCQLLLSSLAGARSSWACRSVEIGSTTRTVLYFLMPGSAQPLLSTCLMVGLLVVEFSSLALGQVYWTRYHRC